MARWRTHLARAACLLRTKRPDDYQVASRWYRDYLASFPDDPESAAKVDALVARNVELAFDLTKQKLVAAKSYPKEILDLKYDPTFVVRGLVWLAVLVGCAWLGGVARPGLRSAWATRSRTSSATQVASSSTAFPGPATMSNQYQPPSSNGRRSSSTSTVCWPRSAGGIGTGIWTLRAFRC